VSAGSQSTFARAGQRLKHKLLAALVLSSGVPMLVLLVVVLPSLSTGISQMLIGLTIVSMLAGAWVTWSLGRIMARMGALMASDDTLTGVVQRRQDEVGALTTSFNRLLATIERQATEINTFKVRLDAADKELESTNARLKESSFRDDTTGLRNRRFLLLRLEEESRLNRPLALVLLEPDELRVVADTVGDSVGDSVYDAAVDAFAQTLMRSAPSTSDVMARYDASRFAVLLVGTPREGALRFVERVRNALPAEYPRAAGARLRVGIASLPEDRAGALALTAAAEAAFRRDVLAD
jgi:diguanylate cyclase (GGDEF)-like protein